jgi:hypothetical protein
MMKEKTRDEYTPVSEDASLLSPLPLHTFDILILSLYLSIELFVIRDSIICSLQSAKAFFLLSLFH